MIKKTLLETICYTFVFLFVYTAISKLLDYENFKAVIGQSPLITRFASVLAIAVPLVEIIVSILLVIARYQRIGLYSSFTLMVLFTAYIIVLISLSEKVPCSCGGVISKMTWKQHIFFNLLFVLLALVGMWLHNKQDNRTAIRTKFTTA
ncbi:MauE/DoxX family redox-associated membrane protein [Chitinophaga sp. 30R24]|uniref:MauE/DoxX family redox-associated membrane protein n=1 Tax=Chitinophaga sp. 30R24 TaxID=3248838 RepID=UPI003B8F6B85